VYVWQGDGKGPGTSPFPSRLADKPLKLKTNTICHIYTRGPGSSVGIATTGWTVRGSNHGEGEIFRTRPDRPWGPPSLLCNGYRVLTGGKAAGAWC
jgi:hypothetical protein